MTWFGASLLFQSEDVEQPVPEVWEERIYLIEAQSEDEALKEAERIGLESEETYLNMDNQLIKFRFRGILSVCRAFEPLLSGSEIFSRPLSQLEAESLKMLHLRKAPW